MHDLFAPYLLYAYVLLVLFVVICLAFTFLWISRLAFASMFMSQFIRFSFAVLYFENFTILISLGHINIVKLLISLYICRSVCFCGACCVKDGYLDSSFTCRLYHMSYCSYWGHTGWNCVTDWALWSDGFDKYLGLLLLVKGVKCAAFLLFHCKTMQNSQNYTIIFLRQIMIWSRAQFVSSFVFWALENIRMRTHSNPLDPCSIYMNTYRYTIHMIWLAFVLTTNDLGIFMITQISSRTSASTVPLGCSKECKYGYW